MSRREKEDEDLASEGPGAAWFEAPDPHNPAWAPPYGHISSPTIWPT